MRKLKRWEKFELASAKYIESKYGRTYGINCISLGGSDSNSSDIQIIKGS